jgi:hypothetical protein
MTTVGMWMNPVKNPGGRGIDIGVWYVPEGVTARTSQEADKGLHT